jgi:NCS1 family nucleobase:cation symporter-1
MRDAAAPPANGSTTEVRHADGRVELAPDAARAIEASPLYNEDLAPVRVVDRTWTTYNYAALWISMAHCIPTYTLSSALIANGMSWWQALITILLGNSIVLLPILANSHAGTKYGIPFPVYARAAYGTRGSNLPALMRAIVACGWFGIQCWIGGEALHTLLRAVWPFWERALSHAPPGQHALGEWIGFGLFWLVNIAVVFRGMDLLRRVENWAAPFVLVMTALLLGWALWRAHGLGAIVSQPGRFRDFRSFFHQFVPSLTAMIGFWATLSLNMPDFTRFGRSQREQMVGQVVALPTTMTVFAAMGVMITSASAIIYGHALWDPVELVGRFRQPLVVAISMFTVVVATLSVNIAANVVSPANDFANAFPRLISFRIGGVITGVIGIAMCPWLLIADPKRYIDTWLVGYSGGLGSVGGVLIADYFLIQRRNLALADLYRTDGSYRYASGWNPAAVIATLLGCGAAWVGAFVPALRPLYDYAWFVGFAVAAGAHVGLTRALATGPAAARS